MPARLPYGGRHVEEREGGCRVTTAAEADELGRHSRFSAQAGRQAESSPGKSSRERSDRRHVSLVG